MYVKWIEVVGGGGGEEGACVCERQETIEVIAVKVKKDGKCGVGRRIF